MLKGIWEAIVSQFGFDKFLQNIKIYPQINKNVFWG
jgi:hypothetical protein